MNKSPIGFLLLLAAASLPAATNTSDTAIRAIAHAPLRFEPSGTRFITRGLSFSSALSASRMDLRTRDQAMRITFAGASAEARIVPGDAAPSVSNVIHGNDRSKWRTARNYSTLRAKGVYPGVDVVYYGNSGDLEYDLLVDAGADPGKIRLAISGVTPALDAEGNLSAAFIQKKPVAYQIGEDGTRTVVASRYRKNSDGTFGFALGDYDRSRELVIDPTLTFSTYIYGSSQDTARAVGHDAQGKIYVAGITLSTDFEIDPNTTQVPGGPQFANNTGGYDLFIAQIDPTVPAGTNPVAFATYLGGTGDDILNDMYVAPSGLVYLTGYTTSTDFPTTGVYNGVANSGFQTAVLTNSKTSAFVVVYDVTQPVGSQLVYSSYIGGGTGAAGNGVTADSKGRVFVVGTTNSSEVPARNGLPAGLQGGSDAFVSGFDPSLSGDASLFYSTFLGGSSFEEGYGITAAPDDTLWVVGETYSNDFPAGYNPASKSTGSADAFVVHIDVTNGGNLLYSTYLGGSSVDLARRVALDASGRVIVSGYTLSTDFPVTGNALQATNKGMGDAFVSILNPLDPNPFSQLVYSTYFGGSGAEMVNGMKVDASGAIYLTGITASSDLAVSSNALSKARNGGQDGFIVKLTPAQGILFSSYLSSSGSQTAYGVDVDAKGTVYLTGSTSGGLFDALNGTGKTTAIGKTDAYLMGFTQ